MIERMFSSITGQQLAGEQRFLVECQPKQPETSSNLSVVCYPNKNRRMALPIKVRWFRLKNNQLTEIAGMRGSTYPCEPSDLGCKIKAEITSLEDDSPGTAEVWFGPIRMDITIKQVLAGVLSTGHTSLSAFLIKNKQKEARLELGQTDISITDIKSEKSFRFEYSLSEPRVQLNPKDTTRLYLRFHKDGDDQLRTFLSGIFECDMEKSTRSQSLQLRNQNKLELKFISRSSRDLLIFGIKAFSAKRDMKSSALIEKIERIDLTKEQMFSMFFQFESIRSDMVRLEQLNRQLIADRERKSKELKDLEEQIASVTATYLKIIEEKCAGGINESYSQLSQKRDDIVGRNRMKALEKENGDLKLRIRDLSEEIEVLQFFKKGSNESVVHSQQSRPVANPFEKKPVREQPKQSMSVLQLSKINVRLLEENNRLKEEHSRFEKEKSKVEMFNLLDSLNDNQDQQAKVKLVQLQQAYSQLLGKYDSAQREVDSLKQKQAAELVSASPHELSLREQSALLSNSLIDKSMTSEAEINLLLEKFNDLKSINDRLLAQNERYGKDKQLLRRENDRLSVQLSQLRGDINRLSQQLLSRSQVGSGSSQQVTRLTEQNDRLRDERRLLLKKLQLIAAEAGKLKNQLELQRRCQELTAELKQANKRIGQLEDELAREGRSLRMSQLVIDQTDKMKEINENLLMEINVLKRENQHLKELTHQQSVERLKKELFMLRQQLPSGKPTSEEVQHAEQLYALQKQLDELKQENALLHIKVKTQTQTIEKLMHEIHDKSRSMLDSSDRSTSKYKRRIKELEMELSLLKRSTDALNRSRDLSMDMEQHNADTIERLSSQMDMILKENERISEMCEKYSKQAKEAQKVRQENVQLRRELEQLQKQPSS